MKGGEAAALRLGKKAVGRPLTAYQTKFAIGT